MTRNFHRWEVDPFFSAAEEVQDSADRLESVYRTWIHTKSVINNDTASIEFYRRELSTALGTAKWQLEEFERAVSHVITDDCGTGDDAPTRHHQFISVLRNQIGSVETALRSSEDCRDLKAYPIVSLAEEEKHDLALFLCGRSRSTMPQDTNFLSSPAPKVGKAEQTDVCATSRILEPKDGMSYCTRTFAAHSATELVADTSIVRSDVPYWTQEGRCTARVVPDFQGIDVSESAVIRVDDVNKPVSDPTSDYFYSDRGENFGEKVNEHHRSVSVGSGLYTWKSGSINDFKSKTQRSVFEHNSPKRFHLLSLFAKTRQLKHWRSGLKRWKDGDANESDSQMIGLMQGQKEVENQGNMSAWCGGDPICCSYNASGGRGENKHYRALGEGLQIWQQSQYALPASRPLQIASAILVALGLVGLLSFHVSSTAL